MKTIKTSPYIPEKLDLEKINDYTADVIAYPFESGFAITLAHPIKRILLSSTVGYAPTAIRIDGVNHEFDSILGALEDVSIFIINLRNIRFKIKDETKEKIEVSYSFSGHQEIKGSDLVSDEVEITGVDNHILTLNDDAKLNFSIILEKGIGYVPSEYLREDVPDGYIPMDAFFTPVRKAVYKIENVLVEDDPNFEKIIFSIETDGLITPEEAFKNALEVMNEQLLVFNREMDVQVNTVVENTSVFQDLDLLIQKIDDIDIGTRGKNALSKEKLEYIGELSLLSDKSLKSIKNLGKKSIEEICSAMEKVGYPIGFNFAGDSKSILEAKIKELKKEI